MRVTQAVDNLIERLFPKVRRRPALAYAIAIALFAAAVASHLALAAWLQLTLPFLTFFIAVLLAALVCGTGPGLVVIAASCAYVWYFIFEMQGRGASPTALASLTAFSLLSCLIVFAVNILNRLVERLTLEQGRSEALLQDSALSELQLEQLNVELRHRLKNTFAVISGLISQSARHSSDISTFASSLSGRLSAMGTSMDIVATHNFQGGSLTELIERTLKPLVPPGKSRLVMKGPESVVSGDVASALGLTLHELGTNAIKYGAWSNNSGRVSVTWDIDKIEDEEIRLDLLWAEKGGPKVRAPERRGLGSALIDGGFPSAQIERDFPDEGVRCRIVSQMRIATTRRSRRVRPLA